MIVTRVRFRIAEMVVGAISLLFVEGSLHLIAGRPIMDDFLAGGITAVVLVRGMDALRSAAHQWPEI